jgi:hypothetical protein
LPIQTSCEVGGKNFDFAHEFGREFAANQGSIVIRSRLRLRAKSKKMARTSDEVFLVFPTATISQVFDIAKQFTSGLE